MNCKICGKEVKEYDITTNEIPLDHYHYVVDDDTDQLIAVCQECFEHNSNIFNCCDCHKNIYDKHFGERNENDNDSDEDTERYYRCRKCYLTNALEYDNVCEYAYKPIPLFFGGKESDNKLFMGIELEMDDGDSSEEMEEFVINQVKFGYSFFYGKHDGSLSNDSGIEIVSHPATLEFHKSTQYWKDMLNKAIELHFKSNDCDCCGIHIHCNRNYFTNLQIQKLDALLNWHSRTFRRFARRNPRHYAAFEPNKDRNSFGRNDSNHGRYSALNFDNEHTIEWRIFKGNLKYESIMALFELVQGVSDYIKQNSITLDFICGNDQYSVKKSLKEYLENRNFQYLPAYTEMCKVWRDLEETTNNG